jgi:hypothetical protein
VSLPHLSTVTVERLLGPAIRKEIAARVADAEHRAKIAECIGWLRGYNAARDDASLGIDLAKATRLQVRQAAATKYGFLLQDIEYRIGPVANDPAPE